MDIRFVVFVDDVTAATEADIERDAERFRQQFPIERDVEGYVVLPTTGRDEPLKLGDTLTYLIPRLCLTSIPELAAGRPAVIDFASSPALITLTPDGKKIVLSCSEFAETYRFPRIEFLRSLVACGERFQKLLRQWHGAPRDSRFAAAQDAAEEAARQALAACQ